jgi:ABC-type sulfate transport system permease component
VSGLLAVTLFSNKTYQNFIKHPTRPQIIKNILGVRVVQFFLSAHVGSGSSGKVARRATTGHL